MSPTPRLLPLPLQTFLLTTNTPAEPLLYIYRALQDIPSSSTPHSPVLTSQVPLILPVPPTLYPLPIAKHSVTSNTCRKLLENCISFGEVCGQVTGSITRSTFFLPPIYFPNRNNNPEMPHVPRPNKTKSISPAPTLP